MSEYGGGLTDLANRGFVNDPSLRALNNSISVTHVVSFIFYNLVASFIGDLTVGSNRVNL